VIPQNDWRNYFEDYPDNGNTKSEHDADETALYLMSPLASTWAAGALGSAYDATILGIFNWVDTVLGENRWSDYGVQPVAEQTDLYFGEFSHTARDGSAKAAYAAMTGDTSMEDQAFRLLSWATYAVQPSTDFVLFSSDPANNLHVWYTDGYADYIRHFMAAMGDCPEWAPVGQSHLVKSTGIVKNITYGSGNITYNDCVNFTTNGYAIDTFRLPFAPRMVTAGGMLLPEVASFQRTPGLDAYTVSSIPGSGDIILEIQHGGTAPVSILT
jgi:hypothetical protein